MLFQKQTSIVVALIDDSINMRHVWHREVTRTKTKDTHYPRAGVRKCRPAPWASGEG